MDRRQFSGSLAELGLNDHHQGNVVNYMRFARYKRSQCLKSVDLCFEDLKDSRLTDDTFTLDEVVQMMDGLETVVRSEVESELINTAHTNVLLLWQLFSQAEKWHLKLQADISDLENRELLEQIMELEEREFAGKAANTKPSFDSKASKLQPLNEGGGAALLHMEIERLKEENEKLRERMKSVEERATGVLKDKSRLENELSETQDALGQAKTRKSDNSGDFSDLEAQMAKVKMEMSQGLDAKTMEAKSLEGDLISTKHKLLEVQEHLELAEKELDKKFQETGAYKNMKKMLTQKNDQIKDLRRRLRQYESDD
ncbi:leucine zipper transcription factor-like protein 1 isoform X1 [Branchiostoma floridae]|uniref:Leucine zipper transcription factor-like protein 1 n=1 Tax=Branchiostoma floridae TaxID=7739 RepID=A0A9J7HET1_BRAFL|nr:leucine zipper transcription factor-like protein 1 isoform X1 [Branchiostoma floridae]